MKVKSGHGSKFSNLSNWKEEAWKISGLQRDSNSWRWCDAGATLVRCWCDAGATLVRRWCDAGATPVRRRCDAGATPVRRRCDTGATPVRRRCDAGATPVRHRCDARPTELWSLTLGSNISCSFRAFYFWSCAQVTAGSNISGSFSAFCYKFCEQVTTGANVWRFLVYHIIDFVQKLLWKQLPHFFQCIL